jgi:MATE family multidrug resistance protein
MNRKILALAIPNIISNITVPLVGMVDMAIVGHLGVDSLIGAMAIGVAIFNFIYWNFAFLRMGTSGLVAQAYGARDFREVGSVFVRSVSVALAVALLLLVARYGVGHLAFRMMDGTPETMREAAEYFYVRLWAAPATLSLFAFQGWFIGMQNSRFPMYISIIVNLLNVAFGFWFVYGLHWGIAGVAWGTVVAQYGGLATASALWLVYYRRFIGYVDLRTSFNMRPMLRFFRVNRDIFLRTACIVVVYTFFTSASSGMGDVMLAVNALLMQLFTLFSYVMDGLAYAGEALSGRYIGARNREAFTDTVRHLFGWGAVIAVLFTLVYALGGNAFLGLLTDDKEVIAVADTYFYWALAVPAVGIAAFIWDGIFIGATATRGMLLSMAAAAVSFFILYYGLHPVLANHALWLAFLTYLLMRGVVQTGLSREVIRRAFPSKKEPAWR